MASLRRILVVLLVALVAAIALPPLFYRVFPEPAPELPPAGRRVEVSPGVGVNVLEAGTGAPVVLIHGHPGSSYEWSETMREPALRDRHVIAYDRVGYGRSDAQAPGPVRVDTHASQLLGLLIELDLRDVVLVGHSYGGGVAITAAKRDPTRIARLVLVGSVGPRIELRGGPPAPVLWLMRGPLLSWVASVPPVWRRFGRAVSGAAFHPAPVPDTFRLLAAANFARPNTLEAFRSEGGDLGVDADLDPSAIDVPIMVLHGEQDQLVPIAVGEAIAARAPRVELRRIPDAGHMLPFTHPALVAGTIAGH